MRRSDLEHIIRAAGSITQDDEIIIIGSQSVLRQRVSMLRVEESIKSRILKRIGKQKITAQLRLRGPGSQCCYKSSATKTRRHIKKK